MQIDSKTKDALGAAVAIGIVIGLSGGWCVANRGTLVQYAALGVGLLAFLVSFAILKLKA